MNHELKPFQSTILIIPGFGNSGPQHWQSIWEQRFNFIRVQQDDWDNPVCSDWIETIQNDVKKHDAADLILVAHSLACIAVVYWAQKFKTPIKSALLVAPADAEAATFPTEATGFKPVPDIKLPFKSIIVASDNDQYVTAARAKLFADSWGSELMLIKNAGHINTNSGLGEWDFGLELLKQLDQQPI